jgi:membrane-bound lytic murein transglycosylase A
MKLIMGFAAIIFVVLAILYYVAIFGSHLILVKSEYSQLPNWKESDQTQGFIAFKHSCSEILKRNPNTSFSYLAQSRQTLDWQGICQAAIKLNNPSLQTVKQFFENWFDPYFVLNNFNSRGLFTGYYLPVLHASLIKDQQHLVPIYSLPKDLIKVNLGLFRPEFAGENIVGQLKNHILIPYPDRASINNGAIKSSADIIAWNDNLIDLFYAQIQGSAIVELPSNKQLLIGYDGDNGHKYIPIGKVLIANHALTKKNISLQTIRTWLLQHPSQINTILNQNTSYVFFRVIGSGSPTGKEGVPLTPEGSIAIDDKYIPLGVPIWLDTAIPQNNPNSTLSPYQHLLIAQDVGGAIKGVVRGDVYWGAGNNAEFIAGHMRSPGRYWILLPKPKDCCKSKSNL